MARKLLLISVLVLSVCLSANAQKKGKAKPKAAEPVVVEPEEPVVDYSENPVVKVAVADTAVLDMADIISAIPLPPHMGRLFRDGDVIVHENEMGDRRFYAATDADGKSYIYEQMMLGNRWSEPSKLTLEGGLSRFTMPFPLPDGETLYFAAADSEGGNLSLYTTMYDSEDKAYRLPQRLPFPFTSDADDLLYIEDETDGVTWFVSCRNQPEGKACLYTLSGCQPWTFYDADETDHALLTHYALLDQVAKTRASKKQSDAIKHALAEYEGMKVAVSQTPTFVVSDTKVCRSADDFASTDAKALYAEWADKLQQQASVERQLEEFRLLFHNTTTTANRDKLTPTIAELETRQAKLRTSIATLAKQIRRAEHGR